MPYKKPGNARWWLRPMSPTSRRSRTPAAVCSSEFGRADILFNNAGITSPKLLADMPLDEWRRITDVNMTGAFLCSRAFAEPMTKQRHGRIINMGSILSGRGMATRTAYCASKAGLANFGAALAFELGPSGITVNTIGATVIVTDLNRELVRTQPQLYQRVRDRSPSAGSARSRTWSGFWSFSRLPPRVSSPARRSMSTAVTPQDERGRMLIQILNGVVYGALLYLLAVGLVLIFGLREVVNFAHGALFMVGAYLGFSVAAAGYWWGGLLVSVIAMGAIGGMLDAAVFRTLRKQDPMVTVLVTFGLLLILETVVTAIWGKAYLRYPMPAVLSGTVTIAGSPFPVIDFLSLPSASWWRFRCPLGCASPVSVSTSARRAPMRASPPYRGSMSIA